MAKHKVIQISVPALKRLFTFLVVLAIIATAGYMTKKYYDERQQNQRAQEDIQRLSDPSEAAKRLEEQTVANVKAITLVPDERPSVVKIEDAEATNLKGQIFFESIEDGDIILTYAEARRIVIYRPSTKQVVTAVTIPEEQSLPQQKKSQNTTPDTEETEE